MSLSEDHKRLALSDPDGFISLHGQSTYDVVMKLFALTRGKVD